MAEKIPTQLNLEIVTPDRQLFCGPVDDVMVPGINGYMGILPGHAPLLSELKIGVISYNSEGRLHRLFCAWGFLEVLSDTVSVLAEAAEMPAEIDPSAARASKSEAELMLRSKAADVDFKAVLAEWEKAVARLEVSAGGN